MVTLRCLGLDTDSVIMTLQCLGSDTDFIFIGPAGHQTYMAIVLITPTATTTVATAILPNSSQLNAPNSVIFQARSMTFCM